MNMQDTPSTLVTVAFASDDVTAMPLATAITSLLTTRSATTQLDIHVLSCGISDLSKARIENVVDRLSREGATLKWHDVTGERAVLLDRFFIRSDRPYPPANYARLLIGDFLGPEVKRVVYLDIDTVALTDLAPLAILPFDSAAALAIMDLPHDSGQMDRILAVISDDDRARFGVNAQHKYFQAGILVMDLEAFRGGVLDEVTEVLRRYPELAFPDQDALNIVLARRHRLIDPRWNQMTAVYWYDDDPSRPRPYAEDVFEVLRSDPYIVHYSGRPKPWEDGCTHPFLSTWISAWEETPWAQCRQTMLTRLIDRIPRARRVLRKKLQRALGRGRGSP